MKLETPLTNGEKYLLNNSLGEVYRDVFDEHHGVTVGHLVLLDRIIEYIQDNQDKDVFKKTLDDIRKKVGAVDDIKLPLNATLIAKKTVNSYLSIVLCSKEDGEYVTWLYNHESKGCFSGHYFKKITDAAQDFEERE